MDFSGILVSAHRGMRLEYPDNTIRGMLAAASVADQAETDVRRTADGVAILSHDPEIQGHVVAETNWTRLASLDLGGGNPPARLDELLTAIGAFSIDIELKNDPAEPGFDPSFAFAIDVTTKARPQDIVTSFHWPTMDAVRRAHPSLRTGLLIEPDGSLDDLAGAASDGGHSIVAPHWWLLGEEPHRNVERLVGMGLEVVVWTVDDEDRARLLAEAGVSVIVTDDPRRIKNALRRNK
jgi:glycerophosphoryl diester phosphodiesterase